MIKMALRSLDWLARIQTGSDNRFSPAGTTRWFKRGGTKARFDQQPVQPHNMVEACIEAHKFTADGRCLAEASKCFELFLGRNDVRLPLMTTPPEAAATGFTPDRASENQGAESTVAWLLSLLSMYRHRAENTSGDR